MCYPKACPPVSSSTRPSCPMAPVHDHSFPLCCLTAPAVLLILTSVHPFARPHSLMPGSGVSRPLPLCILPDHPSVPPPPPQLLRAKSFWEAAAVPALRLKWLGLNIKSPFQRTLELLKKAIYRRKTSWCHNPPPRVQHRGTMGSIPSPVWETQHGELQPHQGNHSHHSPASSCSLLVTSF